MAIKAISSQHSDMPMFVCDANNNDSFLLTSDGLAFFLLSFFQISTAVIRYQLGKVQTGYDSSLAQLKIDSMKKAWADHLRQAEQQAKTSNDTCGGLLRSSP